MGWALNSIQYFGLLIEFPPFPLKLLCSSTTYSNCFFQIMYPKFPKVKFMICISSYLFCWEMHGNQRLESPAWAAELTKSIRKQHRISSSWNSGGLTCKVENWKLELRRKTGDKTTIYLNHCPTRPSMQSSTDTKEAPLAQRPKYFQQTLSHQSWA